MEFKRTTARSTSSLISGRLWLILGLALVVTGGDQLYATPLDCSTWNLLNPLPIDVDLHGVAFQDGHYAVVGDEGAILISENVVAWHLLAPPTSENFNSVIGHYEGFFAVGDSGIFAAGPADAAWTALTTPTTADLLDLASNSAETIVAVGTGGSIVTSLDLGHTWIAPPSGTNSRLNGIVWTGDEFVAAGNHGTVLVSPDGLTWSSIDIGINSTVNAVESNGFLTLAVTDDGQAASTRGNGIWTLTPAPRHLTDIAWVGNRFLVVGMDDQRYSLDGSTWTWSRLSAPGLHFESVGPSIGPGFEVPAAIAVGPGGTIAHSIDGGKHWKPSNTVSGLDFLGLASNGIVAVAAAGTDTESEGAILASEDLINWEVTYWRDLETIYDVASGDGVFMAGGVVNELWSGGSIILTSSDGRNWHSAIESASGTASRPWAFHSITWDGDRWIAGGTSSTLAVSATGSNWHFTAIEDDAPFLGVASNRQRIVAVGAIGWIAVSDDGQSLSRVAIECTQPLSDVTWGNSVFVAVGGRGSIFSSSDGLNWQAHSSGTHLDLHSVHWSGEEFVTVGERGFVLKSTDGSNWVPVDRGTDKDLEDVIVMSGDLVACGDSGLMLRLSCAQPNEPPSAHFAWRPTLPEEGVPVQFFDLSNGDPTGWSWEFEDGTTSHEPTSTHVFSDHGDWPVSLTVDNDHGTDSTTSEVQVRRFCGAPPQTSLHGPESAGSGQPYNVDWDTVLESWEQGEYIVVESRDPQFTDSSAFRLWHPQSSQSYSHPWTDGAVFFYSTYSLNYCPDGSYYSDLAPAVHVNIEPDISDLGEHLWVVPAVASGPGLKSTLWRSKIVVQNPHGFDAPAYLVFMPRSGEGETEVGPRITIPAGASLTIEDALASFGNAAAGAISLVSDRPLNVGSRIFNDQAGGTFGQFLEGIPLSEALRAGGEVRLIELTEDRDSRTNLALANPSSVEVEVRIDYFSAAGELLGTSSPIVPALGSVFQSQVLRQFSQDPISDAFAVVSFSTPGGQLAALASVVDNLTGDPVSLTPQSETNSSRVVMVEPSPVIEHNDWYDVIFAFGTWVAVGPDGLAVSDDGLTWEMVITLPNAHQQFWGLGFNGSQILAVGCNTVVTSADGVTWTPAEWSEGCLYSVDWNGDNWLAIGSDPGGNTNTIATSGDGLSWQHWRISVDELRARDVIWADDRWVAATSTGIAYSSDGEQWHNVDIGLGIEEIAWNGRQFLALGLYDLATSPDGEEWSIQAMDRYLGRVVWAGDQWVVGAASQVWGDQSVYLVSDNGNQWQALTRRGTGVSIEALASDGDNVMAIDYHGWLSFLVQDRSTITVPAVAHTAGYSGSQWRSDLELHNPHQSPIGCTIDYFKQGNDNSPPLLRHLTIEPSSSMRIPDVVSSLFSTGGSGALRISPSGGGVMVSSRTFDQSEDGTYGQLVPGLRTSDAIWYFESGRLIQLSHSENPNSGFRTNIGVVNACSAPIHVTIDLHDGSGTKLGSVATNLSPFAVEQLNSIYSQVTSSSVADGFAVLSTTTPQCSFFAYASVVDNHTNDPILVTARPWHDNPQWLQMPVR